MKKTPTLFTSFRTRVTVVLVLSLLFVTALSNLLIYKYALDSQFSQLREKLKIIAQTAALAVDAGLFEKVPLTREGVQSPAYRVIAEKLKRIKDANPPIKYIYTMTRKEGGRRWMFVVDPDPESRAIEKKGITAYPGDPYDASRFPEMIEAYSAPSSDRSLTVDEWGIVLSGYAPIRNREGRTVGILGVDLLAEDVYKVQETIHRIAIFVLIAGIGISVGLGIWVSEKITRPVENLVEATRSLARGDLRHRVEVGGDDEFGELARSFNEMAASLYATREKLNDYFFRVMQSLVRILEAGDIRARGHSERVFEYAQKTAAQMGFPQESGESLRKMAWLHDVGKLVVDKSSGKMEGILEDEAWKIIHARLFAGGYAPAAAEQVGIISGFHMPLEPGSGWPPSPAGDIEQETIFTQIISLADTYDTMVHGLSDRSALNREEAIAELTREARGRYDPAVTEAFLQVLKTESGTAPS
ncbi:MAG: HAMP domain-containing protein [Candidatus Aureabacteria bacterium]|nr:HAMP domain-containing protein [Candidatus Auribacterota bacterium]